MGDALIFRQLNEVTPPSADERFPTDRTIEQEEYVVGSALEEHILRAAIACCTAGPSLMVEGPCSRSHKRGPEFLEDLRPFVPTDIVFAGDRPFSSKQRRKPDVPPHSRHRVTQDTGIVYPGAISTTSDRKKTGSTSQASDQQDRHPYLGRQDKSSDGVTAVLLDISYFGFGNDEKVSLRQECGLDNERVPIVLKLKNRGGVSRCKAVPNVADKLGALLAERAKDIIVVISAEELRSAGLTISSQVSWARTVQTSIEALAMLDTAVKGDRPDIRSLIPALHFVVTYGPEAALYVRLPQGMHASADPGTLENSETRVTDARPETSDPGSPPQPTGDGLVASQPEASASPPPQTDPPPALINAAEAEAVFVFVPTGVEDEHVTAHPGRMSGFDTLIACSLAFHLARDRSSWKGDDRRYKTTVRKALSRGIQAGRFLQAHGHDHAGPDPERPGTPTIVPLNPKNIKLKLGSRDPIQHSISYAESCGGICETRWLFPVGYVAEIIANGTIEGARWLEEALPSPALLETYRQHFENLNFDWEAVGDVAYHDIVPEVFSSIPLPNSVIGLGTAHGKRRPHFDETWWTFFSSNLRDAGVLTNTSDPAVQNLFANTGSRSNKMLSPGLTGPSFNPARYLGGTVAPSPGPGFMHELALKLAIQVLKYGEGWLFKLDPKSRATREELIADFLHRTPARETLNDLESPTNGYKPRSRALPTNGSQEADVTAIERALESDPYIGTNYREFPYVRVADLWTIDRREMESFRNVQAVLRNFMGQRSKRGPLNIGVFGPPGSGKSTAVTEIIRDMPDGGIEHEKKPYNLSQFTSPSQLAEAFDEIQDLGLGGKMPVVFWDEFDTAAQAEKLGWLRYFIGPMNDGEYFDKQRTRILPSCIFVFAASTLESYGMVESLTEGQDVPPYKADEWASAKGPDFKSRLDAVLDILGVNPPRELGPGLHLRELPSDYFGYLFRRVAVLRRQFRQYFPRLFSPEGYLRIHDGVARAFLEIPTYAHGARSIEKIVKASHVGNRGVFDVSALPPASLLRLQVEQRDFESYYVGLPDVW